jgi:hypothetical protein
LLENYPDRDVASLHDRCVISRQRPSDFGTKPIGGIRKLEIEIFEKGTKILFTSISDFNLCFVSEQNWRADKRLLVIIWFLGPVYSCGI